MKGKYTLMDKPFRYGGIMHNFDMDNEEWSAYLNRKLKCWCCGGVMKNHKYSDGSVHKFYPYIATFKITKGEYKGMNKFRMLCRACAYEYGKGVIEMDGNTYKHPLDFNERRYKHEHIHRETTGNAEQAGHVTA